MHSMLLILTLMPVFSMLITFLCVQSALIDAFGTDNSFYHISLLFKGFYTFETLYNLLYYLLLWE